MTQDQALNERVSLRDFLEVRFDALDKRLDEILPDHEDRIRALEKREPWRTLAEAATAIGTAIAIALGFRQP
jgi:hypothetical protein